ncbi:MAG TPA: hypothetical protein VKE49_09385 [Myxococcaceae bacterium]|nr:hypothetical protein [Myxococcaceae bacterium]
MEPDEPVPEVWSRELPLPVCEPIPVELPPEVLDEPVPVPLERS